MFIDALLRRLGLLRFGPFIAKIRAEVSRDRISGLAAEVAFFGTLSIFPALLMLATALGYIGRIVGSDVVDTSRAVVVDFVSGILTEQGPVNAVESLFLGDFGGVLTLSIATAVYAMSRGFSAVITALDLAYDLPETRSWIRQRVVAVGLGLGSVLFALLMLVMFVAGPLLGGGDAVPTFSVSTAAVFESFGTGFAGRPCWSLSSHGRSCYTSSRPTTR